MKFYDRDRQCVVMYYLHRVVAMAYIPNDNPARKQEIHHIDHNPSNNHPSNLMWISTADHMKEKADRQRKPIICNETGKHYPSIKDAALELDVHYPDLIRALKKGYRCGGYTFRYDKELCE